MGKKSTADEKRLGVKKGRRPDPEVKWPDDEYGWLWPVGGGEI